MSFDVFLNFDGDCHAALDFYSQVFRTGGPAGLMLYGQNPEGCSESDRDRVLYASLPVFGHNLMLSDCPSGSECVKGDNIALTLGGSSPDELKRIFAALSDSGEVLMPLEPTFFSGLFGMVRDRFDVTWQLSLTSPETGQVPFSSLAKTRHSVRSFSDKPVDEGMLAAILEAGRLAPTAGNRQPHRIRVITGEDLAKADECTPCRYGAPAVLLICYDRDQDWTRDTDGAGSGEIDASIVTTHLMLAAQEQGLGSCWVMRFDPQKTRQIFGLADNIIPVSYLMIGTPAEGSKPADRHFERKSLDEILL